MTFDLDLICDVTLTQLPDHWRMTDVRVLCLGGGALAQDALSVLHRLRGGMGRYLAVGASDDAVAGRLCPLRPPCAYAALHNDLPGPFRDGRMPKPFVPMLDAIGDDLLITYRLFGNAGLWANEFRAAIIAGLRMGLDRSGAPPLVLQVQGAEVAQTPMPALPATWHDVALHAVTPIVQRPDGRMRDGRMQIGQTKDGQMKQSDHVQGMNLQSFLTGLRFRAEGMALWHGLRPRLDLPALLAEGARLTLAARVDEGQSRVRVRRGAQTGSQTGSKATRDRQGWTGRITLPPPDPAMMGLLWLCMTTHAGADTAIGAGRYGLTLRMPD